MIRRYKIVWHSNKDNINRANYIRVSNPVGDTSIDAKAALNIFISEFGDLKHNTIIKIQEFDENGIQLGEDIIPSEKTAIVPII